MYNKISICFKLLCVVPSRTIFHCEIHMFGTLLDTIDKLTSKF